MSLIVFALFAAAAFAIIVGFIIVYVRRVANVALTDRFRAAETIVDGHIPDQWVAQINRRIAWESRLPLLRRDVSGTELALVKMDKLVRFYENSPFFENAQAREVLLTQLRETRERWAKMTWDELVSEHNVGACPTTSRD